MIEVARDIQERSNYDKVVFLGDYCDSFTASNLDMFHTLNQLIEFKKEYPEVVIPLLGNHDLTYWTNGRYKCSGFRADALPTVYHFFQENEEHFNIAWQHGKHLFSHAGVTNKWYEQEKQFIERHKEEEDTIADLLNKCLRTSEIDSLWTVGSLRGGGRYEKGGPLWADKQESIYDSLIGYHQYVGHTPIKEKETEEEPSTFTSITYLDTWPRDQEFMHIEI